MSDPAVVTLKEYVDTRFTEIEAHLAIRFSDRDRATRREIEVLDDRLDKMNEIREQLNRQYADFSRQIATYLLRDEYSARHDTLVIDLRRVENLFSGYTPLAAHTHIESELLSIRDWKANITGRVWAIGVLLALFQLVLTIASKVFTTSV